jgi:hypothetical protein
VLSAREADFIAAAPRFTLAAWIVHEGAGVSKWAGERVGDLAHGRSMPRQRDATMEKAEPGDEVAKRGNGLAGRRPRVKTVIRKSWPGRISPRPEMRTLSGSRVPQ